MTASGRAQDRIPVLLLPLNCWLTTCKVARIARGVGPFCDRTGNRTNDEQRKKTDDTEQTFLSDFFIALGSTHPSCPFATRVGAIVVVWGFGTGREKSE
jgi:hypothetical protein